METEVQPAQPLPHEELDKMLGDIRRPGYVPSLEEVASARLQSAQALETGGSPQELDNARQLSELTSDRALELSPRQEKHYRKMAGLRNLDPLNKHERREYWQIYRDLKPEERETAFQRFKENSWRRVALHNAVTGNGPYITSFAPKPQSQLESAPETLLAAAAAPEPAPVEHAAPVSEPAQTAQPTRQPRYRHPVLEPGLGVLAAAPVFAAAMPLHQAGNAPEAAPAVAPIVGTGSASAAAEQEPKRRPKLLAALGAAALAAGVAAKAWGSSLKTRFRPGQNYAAAGYDKADEASRYNRAKIIAFAGGTVVLALLAAQVTYSAAKAYIDHQVQAVADTVKLAQAQASPNTGTTSTPETTHPVKPAKERVIEADLRRYGETIWGDSKILYHGNKWYRVHFDSVTDLSNDTLKRNHISEPRTYKLPVGFKYYVVAPPKAA